MSTQKSETTDPHGQTHRESSDRSLRRFIRGYYKDVQDMPRDGCFTHGAVNLQRGQFPKANECGFITEVAQIRTKKATHPNHTSQITVWTVTDNALQLLEEYERENRKMQMPCGHAGFQNTGDFLTCKECGGRFTKTEVHEYEP